MSDFNPNSTDSLFSQILERLKQQDAVAAEMLAEVRKTNGRVTTLETAEKVRKAEFAIVATGISLLVTFGFKYVGPLITVLKGI